ncbi:hypothetical protein SO802_000118 [Lithocarpus litseifolius]|uniref:Protein FAR1-RELATED SEQUENCE n=1 Tax=Lithocarpus litseifolius TaxID=425828 RepID=A0AAW2DSG7_9ROSI
MHPSDELHSPDNSDGEQKKKLSEFKLEYLKDLEFVLGMSFMDNKQFKEYARAYKLKYGYSINLSTNEKSRVRQVFAHWMAEKYVDQFRTNIEFQAKDLVVAVERDVNMELALSKAYKAGDITRGMVRGDFCEQYSKVRCYCAELRRSNPSTTIRVTIAVPGHNFKRVFVCLATCKEGFVHHCRPLINLDACHLKGVVAGQLLAAVGYRWKRWPPTLRSTLWDLECKYTVHLAANKAMYV